MDCPLTEASAAGRGGQAAVAICGRFAAAYGLGAAKGRTILEAGITFDPSCARLWRQGKRHRMVGHGGLQEKTMPPLRATLPGRSKKKELVGPFKNGGRELRPKGVLVHDFLIPDLGRVLMGCTISPRTRPGSVWGRTTSFCRRELVALGQALYPSATRLLMPTRAAAMGIGSACGSWSCRNWRETGLEIDVCHLPPGTSKWKRCRLTLEELARKAAGEPRGELDTQTGLRAEPTGCLRTVSDELEAIYLRRDSFHGEWNYSLLPRVALLN